LSRGLESRARVEGDRPGSEDHAALGEDHQRHRAIIEEVDLHIRGEAPGLSGDATLAQDVGDRHIQGLGPGGVLGPVEARPAPLADVASEGELADHEDAATDLADVEVHGLATRKYAQSGDLACRHVGVGEAITSLHTYQRQNTAIDLGDDLVFDPDLGPTDPLQHGLHGPEA